MMYLRNQTKTAGSAVAAFMLIAVAIGPTGARADGALAIALPDLPPLAGVRLSAAAAGIRYQGRTDVVMMEVAAGSTGSSSRSA